MDFDKDFPQPPAAPAQPASASVGFWQPELHEARVVLAYPLAVDGSKLDTIIVRRPTARDMIAVTEQLSSVDDDAVLVRHVTAAMCGVPIVVLDALAPDDAGRVAAAALPFYPAAIIAAIERWTEPGSEAGGAPA